MNFYGDYRDNCTTDVPHTRDKVCESVQGVGLHRRF